MTYSDNKPTTEASKFLLGGQNHTAVMQHLYLGLFSWPVLFQTLRLSSSEVTTAYKHPCTDHHCNV